MEHTQLKYKSMVGMKINVNQFSYLYSEWGKAERLNEYSGALNYPITEHRICDKEGALFGQECVYITFGKDFIFPISELERTNQIPKEYINILEPIINNSYSIY